MRVLIVFVVSLCFFLLGGGNDVYKREQVKPGIAAHNFLIIKKNSLSEKRQDFVNVEDDDDLMFTRKQVVLAKSFIPAYPSFFINCNDYVKTRLPFCAHLSYASSYKYILQRVLRI